MFAQPSDIEIIPRTEWDARFDEQEERKSSLEHVYLSGPGGTPAFENLDQGTEGYCWAYSVGHSIMMHRLKCNLQYVRLNPHSIAAIIKKVRTMVAGVEKQDSSAQTSEWLQRATAKASGHCTRGTSG